VLFRLSSNTTLNHIAINFLSSFSDITQGYRNRTSNLELENGDSVSSKEVNEKKEKGFETFLMTGDMIIRTTASPKTRRDASSRNASDSSDSCVAVDMETPSQFINDSIEDSPKLNRTFICI
jgi:hypothetical protein